MVLSVWSVSAGERLEKERKSVEKGENMKGIPRLLAYPSDSIR
jgi:hypothetical protein